ncbi:MAG TPA: efflux RND transporter permease subunit, partial [Bacillota bacterium]
MKITDLSIRRPVGVAILFTLVVLVGLLSLNKLKLDLYPNIQFPIVAVSTNYPGAGSEEIETIIT